MNNNTGLLTLTLTLGFLTASLGCVAPSTESDQTENIQGETAVPQDPHSYAHPEQVAVSHIALDLAVDFDAKTLSGSATLDLDRHDLQAPLLLDTRDLTITAVTDESGQALDYAVGDSDPWLGSPLEINLGSDTQQVQVSYQTSPTAGALQWLDPSQTAGELPFLFSQSQAILARTWVPCQDTPAVRFTYSATIEAPPGFLALMSAVNPQEMSEDGQYSFQMEQPIPSYLLALAVGDLRFAAIGEHTGVYAEPATVEAAAWEFVEVDQMLEAAERLYGKYAWGRYDLLVLPPSFPFGGMENPRLTFATPTILAGDRSLVSLVAHELAHSWSGNLATNANWNDFWLNEGFTTYIELRLMEEVYGPEYAQMLSALSYQDLVADVEEKGATSVATHLRLDLAGQDPDEGMTAIAYDKGALLLRTLEQELGRAELDGFLMSWFDQNAFQPVTTGQLMAALRSTFPDRGELWQQVEQNWIDGPGIPQPHASVNAAGFQAVDQALTAWSSAAQLPDWQTWNTHQRLHFLRNLPSDLSLNQLTALDDALGLTTAGNAEIAARWFQVAIEAGYQPAYGRLEEFLLRVGRRKFLKPLYEALAKTEEGTTWAREVYARARPGYHAVSQGTLDEILGWSEG